MNKFWRVFLGVNTLGVSELVMASNEAKEKRRIADEIEQRRRNSPFKYNKYIDAESFEKIVQGVVKPIKRIEDYYVVGSIVVCTVRTQSGISDWTFRVDFNDFGELTGRYWILDYGNYDSDIPKTVAKKIHLAM